MPDDTCKQAKMDRELTVKADRLIPETQSVIERAKVQVKKNQELLDKIRADRAGNAESA